MKAADCDWFGGNWAMASFAVRLMAATNKSAPAWASLARVMGLLLRAGKRNAIVRIAR
jgi:hypothetical protein